MKTPKILMQEIEETYEQINVGANSFIPKYDSNELHAILNRRLKPFIPEILSEYGFTFHDLYFKRENNVYIEISGGAKYWDIDLYINDKKERFTFPLWKTIDEFENDMARVLESLK